MVNSLQQISEHVWLYPHNAETVQPAVGAIVTGSGVVLIDAGNSPRHARWVQYALYDLDAPPVTHIIYTHHHWDHTFGAVDWHRPLVIGHQLCRTLLHDVYATKPWSHSYIQGEILNTPRRAASMEALDQAITDWADFQVILPEVTFDAQLTLYVDDVPLHLRHVGGIHAADSITVAVDDVLFVGDCYYPPPAHLRQPDEGYDTALVTSLVETGSRLYISGHTAPMTTDELAQVAVV